MAGTVFQDSKSSLMLWFRAMWFITSQKYGASALGVQRMLGLRSYRSAWALLHKLRYAMVRRGRERLSGIVEMDEAYWGGEEEGVLGRKLVKKALIAVAVEERGKTSGRIRLCQIYGADRGSLHGFIRENIEPGSTIRTDGLLAYRNLPDYEHDPKVQGNPKRPRSCHTLTWSFRCSSAGYSEPIKVRFRPNTWTITWMSSPFASIAARHNLAGNSSIASSSKPPKLIRYQSTSSPTTTN
jgi:hypothetical protein